MLKQITEFVGQPQWVVEVFLIVLATAIARLILKLVLGRLSRQLKKTSNLYDDALVDAARRPAGLAVWVFGISFAAQAVGGQSSDQAEIFQYTETLRDVAVI